MAALTPIEERLHTEALRVVQDPDTPADERELAACVLAMFREITGWRSLAARGTNVGEIEDVKAFRVKMAVYEAR